VDIEMRINTNQEEQKDHTFHIPLRIRLQNNGGTKAFICYSKAAYFNHASIWISPYAALPEGSKKRTDYEFDPLLWISERVQQNNPQYKIQNKHKKPKFIEPCVPHWVKFLQDHPEIEPYNMFFEFL
jgi:preprotein translocase subunit SecB